eukprot:TRINITY_DN10797_c0_g1_i2.p1 TRINITY_DN10797_c0_g1~~TRINITY_DN10797_c0_g1_i2.p1  ORF type:complete len:764 (+),score=317.32 TRINITY_DN10797_c0_g1_i2:46-2337(+)
MGGRPYSGKAKKAQLQAKRQKKAAKQDARNAHGSDDDGAAGFDPRYMKAAEEATKEGWTTKDGEEYKYDKRSVFRKESKAEVDKRRRAAQEPYGEGERVFNNGVSCDDWYQRAGEQWFYPIPQRPAWSATDADSTIQRREEKAFGRWLQRIDVSAGEADLNLFERNLEVWRELWRVAEASDVVAIVADARHPLYHVPVSMVEYLRDVLQKPVFVVLNKIDLLPREVLDDWRRYFAQWFPTLPLVEFSCHPARETVTLDPETTLWRRKRTRDSRRHVNFAELAAQQGADESASDYDSASEDAAAPAPAEPTRRVRFEVEEPDKGVPISTDEPAAAVTHGGDDDDDEDDAAVQQKKKKKTKRGSGKGGKKPDRHAEPKLGMVDPSRGSKSLADELQSLGIADDDDAGGAPTTRGGGARGKNKRGKNKQKGRQGDEDTDAAPGRGNNTATKKPAKRGARDDLSEDGSDAEVASMGSADNSDHDVAALAGLDVHQQGPRDDTAPLLQEQFKGHAKALRAEQDDTLPHAERAEVAKLINTLLDTAKQLCRDRHPEGYFNEERKMVLGTVGSPNVGKSSLVNALKGNRVVSTSATAGHTKHLQHIPLDDELMLCDCPGLAFPTRGLPRHAQLLMGSFSIAQNREPYSLVHFLGRHLPLERIYHLKLPRGADPDEPWSGYAFCEAYAEKNGCFLHRGKGLPDSYRGGQAIVKEAVTGTLLLHFKPPAITTPPPGMVEAFAHVDVAALRGRGGDGEEDEEDEEGDEEDDDE